MSKQTIFYIPYNCALYEVYYSAPVIRRIMRYHESDVGVEVSMDEMPLGLWERVIERCREE